MTAFPNPGAYKLWIQVQRTGRVVTLPFELPVDAAVTKRTATAIPAGAIAIDVDASGFSPATL